MASGDEVFESLRVREVPSRYHSLIKDLCGGQADFLSDIAASDLEGAMDADGSKITAPVARGLVRKLQGPQASAFLGASSGLPPQSSPETLPPPPRSLPADPRDVKALRKAVAAIDQPDEGMRGTAADALKLQAASDPAVIAALAVNLRGRAAEAAAAAATLRSIAVTPSAAAAVCEGGMPGALLEALQRPAITAGPVIAWALPAAVRLAQHKETHGRLVSAGFPRTFEAFVHGRAAASPRAPTHEQGSLPAPRFDLVAGLGLAFLSESGGPDLASRVPLRFIPEYVAVLQKRFFIRDPKEIVSGRLFFGLPLYVRPRFMIQATLQLVRHSGAHCATAWTTPLPDVLAALLEGDLESDPADNKPFGSPEALDLAGPCAEALLAARVGGSKEARAVLQAAVQDGGGSGPAAVAAANPPLGAAPAAARRSRL